MRSQKQNNRTPRPFKFKGSERAWSGGKRKDTLPASSKPTPKPNKPGGANTATPPASSTEKPSGEATASQPE